MRKVLIPTDFSRNAWDAIAYAVDLFKREPCEFYILNVYSLADFATDNLMVPQLDSSLVDTFRENSEKGLDKTLKRLSFRDESDIHSFVAISQQNDLLAALKEIVALKDIGLIVMGTKGSTDALNISFGSNTVAVMEKIRNCPVLAIPKGTVFKSVTEIVFPTSFKTHFKKRELDYLIAIARITNAPIRILHINEETALTDKQLNFKSLLEEYFDVLEYSFHFVESKNINEGVALFIQSRNSGMVAFINKKHTFFSTLFSKPLVKELGLNAKIPILALHDFRN
ncbi:MAG: universal stress protein [Flavobacteriaceae bacterium]